VRNPSRSQLLAGSEPFENYSARRSGFRRTIWHMRIAVSPDPDEPVARRPVHELHRCGHQVSARGALRDDDPDGTGRAARAWPARATVRCAGVPRAASGDVANVAHLRELDGAA